jgi:hypothetical protein
LPVTARRSRACCRGSLARLIFETGAAPSSLYLEQLCICLRFDNIIST